MAWQARSGLKLTRADGRANGYPGLNGLASPFGVETFLSSLCVQTISRLNGLASPFGVETVHPTTVALVGEKEEGSSPGSPTTKAVTSSVLADLRPPARGRQWSRPRSSQGAG